MLSKDNSTDAARDVSADKLEVAVAVKPVIAPFKLLSAAWKAPTISVNESIAAGSELFVIKLI